METDNRFPTDRELVSGLVRNQDGAWDLLRRRHRPVIVGAVRRTLGTAANAERVQRLAEEVQEQLFLKPAVLRGFSPRKGTLAQYVAGIARKVAQHDLHCSADRPHCSLPADLSVPAELQDIDCLLRELAELLTPREVERLRHWIDTEPNTSGKPNQKTSARDRAVDHRLLKKILRFLRGE